MHQAEVVRRPALQRGLTAGQEVVPPAGEDGGGDPDFAGDGFQAFATRRQRAAAALHPGEKQPRSQGFVASDMVAAAICQTDNPA